MKSSYQVVSEVRQIGIKKYQTPFIKLLLLGLLAGAYIGIGALLATLSASGFGAWSEGNPMLPKLIAGFTFPVGLMLVVLVGAELFTGNTAYLIPATYFKDIPRNYFLKNWLVIYLTNFVGAVFFAYFIAYLGHIFETPDSQEYLRHVAEHKLELSWWTIFLRGIGANWLVCLAVWLGFSSESMLGRLVGIWWPVMAFVALGLEHSVANMFYVPTAIFYGANIAWAEFILHNLLPATFGNIIGGTLFVGCIYSYLYGDQKRDTIISK